MKNEIQKSVLLMTPTIDKASLIIDADTTFDYNRKADDSTRAYKAGEYIVLQ